jgi:hypothetical protein
MPGGLLVSAPQTDNGHGGEHKVATVSFADLVFAHHLRQVERYRAVQEASTNGRAFDGSAEQLFVDRLRDFQKQHGTIIQSYWCTYEISGLALTREQVRLPWWRLRRTEPRIHMHAEVEWATRDSPELAHQLHKIDNLAVRADEVLRGTGEHIAMQLLMAAERHVLSYVDRKDGPPRDPETIRKIVASSDAEIAEARKYYDQAAGNASRIVYAGGMLWGAFWLALISVVASLILWPAGAFSKNGDLTWTVFACIAAGGIGAALSVLLRMARGNFSQDYEVGRKITRRLAMARPFIGATFAVVIFLGLKSKLVDLGLVTDKARTIYFYAVVGFVAGFSERWARVLVTRALGGDESEPDKGKEADDVVLATDAKSQPVTQLDRPAVPTTR